MYRVRRRESENGEAATPFSQTSSHAAYIIITGITTIILVYGKKKKCPEYPQCVTDFSYFIDPREASTISIILFVCAAIWWRLMEFPNLLLLLLLLLCTPSVCFTQVKGPLLYYGKTICLTCNLYVPLRSSSKSSKCNTRVSKYLAV